jgi:hypothetical protein
VSCWRCVHLLTAFTLQLSRVHISDNAQFKYIAASSAPHSHVERGAVCDVVSSVTIVTYEYGTKI